MTTGGVNKITRYVFSALEVFNKKKHTAVGVFFRQPNKVKELMYSNSHYNPVVGEKTNTNHGRILISRLQS